MFLVIIDILFWWQATLSMKADIATNKSDITKYFLGAIFSSSAFCIGILYRLFSTKQ